MELPVWLATLALVLGLGSITTSFVVSRQEACNAANVAGAHTRQFIDDLLADPRVPPAQRAAVVALALKDFPRQHC